MQELHFVLLCFKEWAPRLIFICNLGNLSMIQCPDNCVGKFMTAHQSIYHSTYKHTFAHQSILHSTYKHTSCIPKHTKAFHMACMEHSFCTPKYVINEVFSSEFTMQIWRHEIWLPHMWYSLPYHFTALQKMYKPIAVLSTTSC